MIDAKKEHKKAVYKDKVLIEGCVLLPSLTYELYPHGKIIYKVQTEDFPKVGFTRVGMRVK